MPQFTLGKRAEIQTDYNGFQPMPGSRNDRFWAGFMAHGVI
jgi:hypothetical protein